MTTIVHIDDNDPTIPCERPSMHRISRHSLVACSIPVLPPERDVSAGNGADAGRSAAAVETTRRAPEVPIWTMFRQWLRSRLGLTRSITFAELRVVESALREHEAEQRWNASMMDVGLLKAWGDAKTELSHACVALEKERAK